MPVVIVNRYDKNSSNEIEIRKRLAVLQADDRTWSEQRQRIKKKKVAMGIQSQGRNGSIKKCLKRGTKTKGRKYLQLSVHPGEDRAFSSVLDCVVCRAVSLGKKKPHRGHHLKCEKSNKKKEHANYVDDKAAFFKKINNTPITKIVAAPNNSQKDSM